MLREQERKKDRKKDMVYLKNNNLFLFFVNVIEGESDPKYMAEEDISLVYECVSEIVFKSEAITQKEKGRQREGKWKRDRDINKRERERKSKRDVEWRDRDVIHTLVSFRLPRITISNTVTFFIVSFRIITLLCV